MEIYGGAAEAEERGSGELLPLLEAIKTSEVLENRIALINQLERSSQFCAGDLGLILESLVVSWDDSTCSGVSHCTLHKSVMQVALKCTESDTTAYLGQLVTIGAKTGAYGVGFLGAGWKCRKESEFTMEDERSRRRHPRTPRYVPRSHHHFALWPRRLQSSYGYGIIRPTVKTTPAVGEVVCIDRRSLKTEITVSLSVFCFWCMLDYGPFKQHG